MEQSLLKRPAVDDVAAENAPPTKRQRSATSAHISSLTAPAHGRAANSLDYDAAKRVTAEDLGREGLQRSIVLALRHVGFDSATEEAVTSFTETVETYTENFIESLKRRAQGARRTDPTPADFAAALRCHNIALSSLKPHLKNPVPKQDLSPTFYNPITEDTTPLEGSTPVLGDELDGRYEKEERSWIPKHFPSFPSKHTYRWTPAKPPKKDNQKKKAEAQADARKGELALRRIDRAAKITRQKDLKEIAQRNEFTKQRHDAWEGLMGSVLKAKGATEIADHSTVVNAGAKYGRKEMLRAPRRNPLDMQTT